MKELYNKLMELYREIAIISEITSVLGWDQLTMMPPKGNDQRSDQFAYLYGLIHEKEINPEINKLITQIKDDTNYDNYESIEESSEESNYKSIADLEAGTKKERRPAAKPKCLLLQNKIILFYNIRREFWNGKNSDTIGRRRIDFQRNAL